MGVGLEGGDKLFYCRSHRDVLYLTESADKFLTGDSAISVDIQKLEYESDVPEADS
jgi:hypothetical protein